MHSHEDEIQCGFLSEVYRKFSFCCLFIPCVWIFLKSKSFFLYQEFITCFVPFLFCTSLDVQQVPPSFVKLHSLLKKFLPKYYCSSAGKALSAMVKGLHAIRTAAVVCLPLSTFEATLLSLKGEKFIKDY